MNDKELLGEFFINVGTEKNRTLLVELINKFINLYPKFKPLAENDKCRSYFKNYCKKNSSRKTAIFQLIMNIVLNLLFLQLIFLYLIHISFFLIHL